MRWVEAVQSLGKLVASQASYYTEQLRHSVGEDVPVLRSGGNGGRADYYSGHESPSRWMGSGLDRLDLEAGARVDNEVFTGLMAHRTPNGERMTVPRSHGKVAAYDHTFSAPKSVSLLYAYGGDEIRSAVVAAHRKAVSDGVGYMEERCSVSRVSHRYTGADGESRSTSRQVGSEGYVAAGFDHFTSRANDPQVHTHVVVINRVWAEGGWRAIAAKVGYAHLKAGGTVYQASLRKELTQRLGVAWQQVHDGMADIAGFSPELLRHYSTRRREIEEAVERYVAATGKEAHPRVYQKFTLETRQPKTYPRGEAAVTQEMKDYGITSGIVEHWNQLAVTAPEDVEAVVRNSVRVATPPSRRVGSYRWSETPIVEEMADRRAVFTERDLLPEVAGFLPQGATPNELVDSARRVLEEGLESGRILRVIPHRGSDLGLPKGLHLSDDELAVVQSLSPRVDGPDGPDRVLLGEARYTTYLQLQREQRILDAVHSASPVGVNGAALESAITNRGLVGEQAAAVRHLADLDGRRVALVGPGGSGKTLAVGVYADAARTAGHHVVGVATSATAARRLCEELSGGWSGTIAMMRYQLDSYDIRLPEGTVIVVDEASMVSTRDLAWLVSQAEHCDGKIVLVGDPKQLPSIDSGGLFHRIVAEGQGVVTDLAAVNQRQTHDLDRHALDQLRQGQVASTVHEYGEAGRLHLGGDEYATKTALVDAWWTDARTHGVDQVRMLASRRDEVAMLNQLARVHMKAQGLLHRPALVNRWGTEFQAGDRIVVRDNWYSHSDLRNGQTGTITTVNPDTRTVKFLRDIDGVVVELPGSYVDSSVDHAYAQTIHTAQGQTFGTTHLYIDTGVAAEHGYTALSRARDETHLWVNTSRAIDGRCVQPGQPAYETPVEALVRQLTRSVVQPPALAQGLAVEDATDQQLLQSLHNLEREIHRLDKTTERVQWIEDHADLLHAYTAIKDELTARITALAITYQLKPPADMVEVLGRRPSDPDAAIRWDTAASRYAAARVSLGPDADLTDLSTPEARLWQSAVDAYHPLPELEQRPTLKMVG
jgi:conjugative relaxase-like TrwC/TraI family protein